MSMQDPVLSLLGATTRLGGPVAVSGLNFDVRENQVLGLIGPNGSGKSTTLNLISGALPARMARSCCATATSPACRGRPSRGWAWRGPSSWCACCRRRAFWKASWPGPSSATGANGAAETQARRMLDRVGMGRKLHLGIGQLTYIDTKRVELARALAGEPRVLLLDGWRA